MADDGFTAFLQAAYPGIVGQLRLLTGDLASAEDVAQEAFTRAAGRWPQLALAVEAPAGLAERIARGAAAGGGCAGPPPPRSWPPWSPGRSPPGRWCSTAPRPRC